MKNKTLTVEAYLKPSQTSTVNLFAKINNTFKPLTILVKSIALDDWLGSVNYFSKKLHFRCLTGLWGTSGLPWNVSLYSTSNLYVNQTFSMFQYK